jgi:hypothetical protein
MWLIVRLLLELLELLLELLVELLLRLVALSPEVRAVLALSSGRERAQERREWALPPGEESGSAWGAGSRTPSPPSAVGDRGCGVLAAGGASGTWNAGGASVPWPDVTAPEVEVAVMAWESEAVASATGWVPGGCTSIVTPERVLAPWVGGASEGRSCPWVPGAWTS